MPSAKQIKARKAFVKKYAKKGKRKKPYWYAGTMEQFDQTKKQLAKSKKENEKWSKEHFKKKSNADLRRIVRTKKGNTDDEGAELSRRLKIRRLGDPDTVVGVNFGKLRKPKKRLSQKLKKKMRY